MKDPETKKRLRFIKELERFLSRASNYLSKDGGDWAGFCAITRNAPKLGDVKLYSARYGDLIRVANDLIVRAGGEPIALSDIADRLRGELNRYEKNERQRSYSRQKTRLKQSED
ncbi:MAG: hypothetical protein LBI57_02855 [Helicobacteraceae bacterium]|jgi:hypothetical protein|nr:hypothetical protein [Helicobacteraceae bacterium]